MKRILNDYEKGFRHGILGGVFIGFAMAMLIGAIIFSIYKFI